ncbi:hypothetical protein GUJ93_ZPchr0001g33020 [Zizania palustris]|uniref:Uncharacterized protein n=1 Tax=Zizania palustris TaxID=103762 RepID=A0A8J5S467_ZIZPA|nr:hypothetical protein GUJ93_ZPchr0001g33020 [Zizania palustris]
MSLSEIEAIPPTNLLCLPTLLMPSTYHQASVHHDGRHLPLLERIQLPESQQTTPRSGRSAAKLSAATLDGHHLRLLSRSVLLHSRQARLRSELRLLRQGDVEEACDRGPRWRW